MLAVPGVRLAKSFATDAAILVEIEPSAVAAVRRLETVDDVEPVQRLAPASDSVVWGARKIGSEAAWQLVSAGLNASISILDSGIDSTHFGNELPATGDCMYDSYRFISTYANCWDFFGHGSTVTGVAAAEQNGSGLVGPAYLLGHLRVFKVCSDATSGGCWEDALYSALMHIEANVSPTRHIINMSLAGPTLSKVTRNVLTRLYEDGHLLVASAGNYPNVFGATGVMWPAAHPDVIAVSGTLEDDSFASNMYCSAYYGSGTTSSQSGSKVEIAAPFWTYGTALNGSYGVDCGTSFAAPLVSATAALVWTRFPTWSNQEVRDRMNATAVDLGSSGRDIYFGFGRVSVSAAVDMGGSYSATIHGPEGVKPNANCYWTASTSVPSPTYTWKVNGVTSGVGQVFYHSSVSSFDLLLEVTSGSNGASASRTVSVSSSNSDCLDY